MCYDLRFILFAACSHISSGVLQGIADRASDACDVSYTKLPDALRAHKEDDYADGRSYTRLTSHLQAKGKRREM